MRSPTSAPSRPKVLAAREAASMFATASSPSILEASMTRAEASSTSPREPVMFVAARPTTSPAVLKSVGTVEATFRAMSWKPWRASPEAPVAMAIESSIESKVSPILYPATAIPATAAAPTAATPRKAAPATLPNLPRRDSTPPRVFFRPESSPVILMVIGFAMVGYLLGVVRTRRDPPPEPSLAASRWRCSSSIRSMRAATSKSFRVPVSAHDRPNSRERRARVTARSRPEGAPRP